MTKEEKIADVMDVADEFACAYLDFRSERGSREWRVFTEEKNNLESKLRELIKDD